MHQWPIYNSKRFPYTKTIVGTWRSTHVIFHLVKKPLVLVKNDPNRQYGLETIPFSSIFRHFWGLFNASGTQIGFKIGSHLAKWTWRSTHIIFNLVKKPLVLVKNNPKEKKKKKNPSQKNWYRTCCKHPNGNFCSLQIWYNFTVYGRFWPLSETKKVPFKKTFYPHHLSFRSLLII